MANTPTTPGPNQLFSDLNVHEYLKVLKRRKMWILLPALAVTIAVGIVAWRIPNVYRCETVILVDPQKVPENYVRPMVTNSIADRLSTIYEAVTSPARLKELIDSMGLYPELRKQVGEQEVIRIMQQSIGVEPVNSLGSQLSAFRITFKGKNAVETTQVTNQIAAMFISENLKAREQESYGTADFLEGELQKTSQQLQAKETELAEIRARYVQDLPESEQFHVQEAESLRMQLRGIDERIGQDQQQKVYLQSVMAATAPTIDMDLGAGTSPYQSQIENLQNKLSALTSRYGPAHPDVRRLEAELKDLKAKQGPEAELNPKAAGAAARKGQNPVVESQIEKLDEDIQEQKKRAADLQEEINFHISKIERVPIFQQKTAGIMRDYDALRARYSSLLEKKLTADTSTAMESRQKSERFVVLDAAQVPEKPYAPNRPLLAFGGLIAGFFLGVIVAVAREVADESVRDEREVERILGRPVLTGVPEILTSQQLWSRRLRLGTVTASTLLVAVVIGFGAAHLTGRFF